MDGTNGYVDIKQIEKKGSNTYKEHYSYSEISFKPGAILRTKLC